MVLVVDYVEGVVGQQEVVVDVYYVIQFGMFLGNCYLLFLDWQVVLYVDCYYFVVGQVSQGYVVGDQWCVGVVQGQYWYGVFVDLVLVVVGCIEVDQFVVLGLYYYYVVIGGWC